MVPDPSAKKKTVRGIPPIRLKSPEKIPSTFEHGTRATKDSEKLRHSRIHSGVSNYADLEEFDSELDDPRDRPAPAASDESDVDLDDDHDREYLPDEKEAVSLSSSSESPSADEEGHDKKSASRKIKVEKSKYLILGNVFIMHLLVSVDIQCIYTKIICYVFQVLCQSLRNRGNGRRMTLLI